MLPGYNHNIRYKEKVFHVQTEDNGLDDPDLVTQVFLGGTIVAIERSSYTEVLFEKIEEKVRDEKIKNLMQDQHKRLLKALVHGEYDAKIEAFIKAAANAAAKPAEASAETRQPMPRAPSTAPMSFEALDAAILAAEQNPITPESLLAPDAVLELSTNVLFPADPRKSEVTVSRTPTPSQFLIDDLGDLKSPPDRSDSDSAMLGMIEQHVHQQMPWTPATPDPSTRETLEESSPKAVSHIQRARELAKNADGGATKRIPVLEDNIEINELPTKLARRRPSNSQHEVRVEGAKASAPPTVSPSAAQPKGKTPDTLVDYGLPASLRREIDEEIARRLQAKSGSNPGTKTGSNPGTKTGSNPGIKTGSNPGTKVPEAPAKSPVYRQQPQPQKPEGRYSSVRKTPQEMARASAMDNVPTPVDLNLEKAPQKAMTVPVPEPARSAPVRKPARPAAPDPKTSAPAPKAAPAQQQVSQLPQGDDSKRPSILVVERSLDEVILSYLYDDMAEK